MSGGACSQGGTPPTPPPSATAAPSGTDPSPTVDPLGSQTASAPGTELPTTEPTPAGPPEFDASEAMAVAQFLAKSIGVRVGGTEGDVRARDYLERAFRMRGWQVEQVPFDLPQGGTSANVVATWDGRGMADGPVVVVGAHMDTVPGTVGANDNASGTGVVVALATALAPVAADLPVPVVLVAFGAEEYQPGTRVHHVGSEALAGQLGERTVAMLSIDMVGNGPSTRVVLLRDRDATLQQRLLAVATAAGIADVVPDARGDISDHGPFALRGVPAAFLWTGDDGRLHTPADTFEHLDVTDVERAGDLALEWLLGLTDADREGLRPGTE